MNKDIVTVTDAAKEYINKRCNNVDMLVSVRINNRGCSGHSYEYGLISRANTRRFDEIIEWPGGGLVIDSASVMHVLGSVLDLKTSIMERYLYWQNPNAVDTCGCGTSFGLVSE